MTIQKRIKRLWALLRTEEVLGENRTDEPQPGAQSPEAGRRTNSAVARSAGEQARIDSSAWVASRRRGSERQRAHKRRKEQKDRPEQANATSG